MKSLTELADDYDECAKALQATAEMFLAGATPLDSKTRERQCRRADWLIAEALALKGKAAELRKMEVAMFDELRGSHNRWVNRVTL